MKNIIGCLVCLVFLLLVTSCETKPKEGVIKADSYLSWEAIANKILERCQLQSGEHVLLVGEPGRFDPLIPLLKSGIESAGASYLGAVSITSTQPESWKTDFASVLKGMSDEELPLYLSSVDLGIMLPGATPDARVYSSLQEILKNGNGHTIHFHWSGAYSLNGQLLEPDSSIDIYYQDVLIKTDYDALAKKQEEFENDMRKNWVHVTTPQGTDIKFQIGDRQVTKQDGNASMSKMKRATTLIDREIELPAGAIRVAPIEETVNGIIAFPDSDWSGKMVKGLVMKFEKGKVVEINAEENLESVQNEIDHAGEAGKSFREFALGFNPMLAIPDIDPWIPYYGYGAGVVRLSLGDNTELGGIVSGGYVRWNFFVDATVVVGNKIWVENGKLIK